MSFNTNIPISLINLSSQLPFEIDDELKKELCFGEALIMSCGHYEGNVTEELSEDEWSCHETTESEESEEVKDDRMFEVEDKVEEEAKPEKDDELDNDFHFFFFPDCSKSLPVADSKTSVMIVDGMPKINPAAAVPIFCTCPADKKSGQCTCFTKLPCKCGAKVAAECTCSNLKDICVCTESKPPLPKCTCKESKVCLCHPDKVQPVCACDKVDKPCVCYPDKFPSPLCRCKHKPKFNFELKKYDEIDENGEEEEKEEHEDKGEEVEGEQEPCECQKPDLNRTCLCLKDKECTCNEHTCICGVQKTCICTSPDVNQLDQERKSLCKGADSKSICSCPDPKAECTCDAKSTGLCKCFAQNICKCGDPENCKCHNICDCRDPCICDTVPEKDLECICLDKSKQAIKGSVCTCPCKEGDSKVLKKIRAGKHGYRWCHDVDPKHTYFDYGYDRHDKISYKEQEKEKFKILGLNEENAEDTCPVHGIKAPPFQRKIRKPSLDCCSAVGGISISVETLGEDKDKFLIQVVSYSSKEGAKTGAKLVSIVDCNLHTMEENRIEHITKRDITKERRSYMAICESGYYNKVTRTCGERNVVKRIYHSFEAAHNFLLEGANVVLLRYLGLRRYRGNIKTDTVMMDGLICESIYVCHGVSQAIVNAKPMFVVKVERHIIEPSGFIHQTMTVLTLRGYMVSHEWADSCYILHLNPLLRVIPEKDQIESHAPLREKWREDLQLLSDYLDFKSMRSSEGARYVTESGSLTSTIRDYLQALLLLRPHDAIHFTRHYFGEVLSALDLPHDEYFDPGSKHVRYFFFEE